MLMNHIPMDNLVALAEERRSRLQAEAENHRIARAVAGPSPLRRLLDRLRRAGALPGRIPPERPRLTTEDHDLCG